MKEPQTENEMQKDKKENHATAISSWVLRLALAIIWFFIYVLFIWDLDYRNNFEKGIGFSALTIGAAVILLPKSMFGEKKWKHSIYAFIALSALLIIMGI